MEESLFEALRLLVDYRLSRLFVWDSVRATVFSFITKSSLITHIIETCTYQSPDWDLKAVQDCNLGVPADQIHVITADCSVADALQMLVAKRWKSCPVIDASPRRKYLGLFSLTAFHRLFNRCLMEPAHWGPRSTVESVLKIMQQQEFAHPTARVCKYDLGPVQSSNVFINRLSPEGSPNGTRDVPILVHAEEIRDSRHDLANYLSTSPAVQAVDLTLKQVFAHLALAEDKRIILLDTSFRIRRLITPTHLAKYILYAS